MSKQRLECKKMLSYYSDYYYTIIITKTAATEIKHVLLLLL